MRRCLMRCWKMVLRWQLEDTPVPWRQLVMHWKTSDELILYRPEKIESWSEVLGFFFFLVSAWSAKGLQMLCHSPGTGVATGKIGSKQTPIQKHSGRSSIDRKTGLHLSNPQYLLKCDVLSYEGVVKTVQTSLPRNKELRQVRDFSPSILWYGALPLFRTNFRRCYALLSFVTSSLVNPFMFTKI